MKITTALKDELAQWLDAYWTTYLKGDIATWATFIRDDYRNIGGTKEEIWNCKQEIIDYTNSIMDQMIGTVDIRNREIDVIPYGEYMMVHEFTDLYVKIEGEWILYGPFRMSSLLEKTDTGWIALHQHGSYPDMKALKGEAFSLDAVKAENIKLLEAVKSRTFELEIEAALERVRSTSMAMHNSQDLSTVVYTVFTELVKLDAQLDRCLILIVDTQTLGITWYLTGKEGLLSNNGFLVPDNTHPSHQAYLEGWRTKRKKWEYLLAGEEKQRWDTFGFAETELAQLPDFIKADMAAVKAIHLTISSDDFGCLIASSLSPLSETHASIVERFTIVFNQTYTRFLDLQKAEAQAREAQIEAALERVRSRSMAMHKSEEFPQVIQVMFEQFLLLDFKIDSAQFDVSFRETDDLNLWTAAPGQPYPAKLHIPYADYEVFNSIKKAKKAGHAFVSIQLTKEEKNDFFNYFFLHAPNIPEERKIFLLSSPGVVRSAVLLEKVSLAIQNYSAIPYSDAEHNILKRFAKVFEQTYTRFLDLQKAEAQAREAKIEAALERVRSKTMAMHKSEQLPETAQVLFEQFAVLGKTPDRMSIGVYNEELGVSEWWVTDQEGIQIKHQFTAPLQEPTHAKMFSAWKEGKESIVIELEGDDLKEWVTFVRQVVKMPMDESRIKGRRVHQAAFFSQGQLLISSHEALPVESVKLLVRFAKVFSQTYTRFLDLQKAEAQAREAQIESALERVRSKAMAMRTSEDIAETTAASFDELKKLDIFSFRSGVGILTKGSTIAHVFADSRSIDGQVKPLTSIRNMEEHPALKRQYEAWEQQEDYEQILTGDELKSYYSHAFFQASTINVQEVEDGNQECGYYFAFPDGLFYSWSYQPYTESEKNILRRFRNIIALTFRRFLDLQKAEAQTREAQIEAALERIRSRALAMHRSEEFSDVAKVMREQMGYLGQPELETSAVHLYDEDADNIFSWRAFRLSSYLEGNIISGFFKIPKNSCAIASEFIQKFNSNATEYTIEVSGEKQTEWYKILFKLAPEVEEAMKISGTTNDIRYYHFSKFSGGAMLMVSSKEPANDAIELQKRSAQVFDLAYRRFKDLQKAEAQALEAIKRASVDRVRAEIASMRTTSDLDRIQPLIWNELNTLGVPFIRCGVFIMDEAKQELQAFLSTPDGKSIAAFHLPYHSTDQSMQIVAHWQQKQLFKDHMDEAAFAEYTKNLVDQGAVASDEKYVTENRPKDLYLHFLPFLQGMLYVGNDAPLKEDELELVQNLAETFSTAYARYEDFNKLEAAKNEVDMTLQELKQTQGQLIQAEKLASLGQLTAGIAHEIKNPLNFINNFSEVSGELIDEVLAELHQSDFSDAKDEIVEMLNSVKSNLSIIHQHGSRADGIVKSMLMHSRSSTGRKEPADLNALIRENVNLAFHAMRAKGDSIPLAIELELDDSVGEVLLIMEDFSRVILNLCNNAFDAMRQKGETSKMQSPGLVEGESEQYAPKLILRTKRNEQQVTIEVEDNGSGIPEGIRDKIFQPFFTTKKGTQGTGLGLSITHDIVKAHGGTMEIETESGNFSRFIINIT
jgi:signal transduction histidine kinase